MSEQIFAALTEHMSHEETFQAYVSASLRDTSVALATVATRLEGTVNGQEKLDTKIGALVDKVDKQIGNHETRISDVERSVRQASRIAKWFFSGGLIALCSSAYFVFKLVESLKETLESMHK